MFSIALCAWNDLEYLKILHRGLRRNTSVPYELLVHDNGSTDGTEEWLKANHISYTRSSANEGVAAVNHAAARASYDFLVDINADMYPLPGWDSAVLRQIEQFKKDGVERYTISACLVEPRGNNPEYTIANHGNDWREFNEESLLQAFAQNELAWRMPTTVQYSHPVMMPTALWREFGGVDTDYFPGYSSDHDLAARAYAAGCRHFCRLGSARVYHFGGQTLSKHTAEVKARNGEDIFIRKWGVDIDTFRARLGVNGPYQKAPEGVFGAGPAPVQY